MDLLVRAATVSGDAYASAQSDILFELPLGPDAGTVKPTASRCRRQRVWTLARWPRFEIDPIVGKEERRPKSA